ncbi:prepilin-type N-terminal cleavage/methylation domain-containing protein [Pseudoxanthomonas sp. LjRoot143]|uniref:PilW family protein n=1 Tax=Pseudoxanthomonas sp. LjRoot143 TaxID=3342266 RepID=UPI003ECCE997
MTHSPRQVVAAQRGFTLIELMVALLLGLLVVAAAGSLFLSNSRVYGASESIGRIQENQRSAFEILARDIREAGINPCLRIDGVNTDIFGVQLAAPDAVFWSRFVNGIFGVDGTGANGSDEITLYAANGTTYSVSEHKRSGDAISVGIATSGIANGQLLMICNTDHAVVFSATGVTSSGTTIGHTGTANCGANFTRPGSGSTNCTAMNANPRYCFWLGAGVAKTAADTTACPGGIGSSPAYVVAPVGAVWTVADNGRGGSSLYRTLNGARSEIAEGVTALGLTYKVGTAANYVNAAGVAAAGGWSQVTAVRARMTFQAEQGALSRADVRGVDDAVLTRTLDDYIVLRNHQDIQ